jgi:cytoskeletal protein RodZ
MDEFNDPELGRELRRAVPGAPMSTDRAPVVLDALKPRMSRARRRRQAGAAIVSSATAALVAVVAVATLGGSGATTEIHVAGDPSTTSAMTTTTVPATTSTTLAPSTTAPPATTPTTVPTTSVAPGTTPPPAATAASTTTRTPQATTAPTPPAVYTVTSRGGSVVFTWTSSAVTASKVTPAAGWTMKVSNDSSPEVEVDFQMGKDEVSIVGQIDHGQFVYSVDDSDSSGPHVEYVSPHD